MAIRTSIEIDAQSVAQATKNVQELYNQLLQFKEVSTHSAQAIWQFITANNINLQTIKNVTQVLQQHIQTLPLASQEYQAHQAALINLTQAMQNLGQQSNVMLKDFSDIRLLVSQINYTIQDSAYLFVNFRLGMMAVANNLPFIVQSFANLRQQVGSTREVFSLMLQTLRGPLGLVAGISLLVTILQALALTHKDSTQKIKEDTDILKKSWDEVIDKQTEFWMKISALEQDLRNFKVGFEKAIEIDVEIRRGAMERIKVLQEEINKLEQSIKRAQTQQFAVVDIENARKQIQVYREEIEKLNDIVNFGSRAFKDYEKRVFDLIDAVKRLNDTELTNFILKQGYTENEIRATIKTLEEQRGTLQINSEAYKSNIRVTEILTQKLKDLQDQIKKTTTDDLIKQISEQIKAINILLQTGAMSFDEAQRKLNVLKRQLESINTNDLVLKARIQSEIQNIEKIPADLINQLKKKFEDEAKQITLRFKLGLIDEKEAISQLEGLRKRAEDEFSKIKVPEGAEAFKLFDADVIEQSIKSVREGILEQVREIKDEVQDLFEVTGRFDVKVDERAFEEKFQALMQKLEGLRKRAEDERIKIKIEATIQELQEEYIRRKLEPIREKLDELRTLRAFITLGVKITDEEDIKKQKEALINEVKKTLDEIPDPVLKRRIMLEIERTNIAEIMEEIDLIMQQARNVRGDVELRLIGVDRAIRQLNELKKELDVLEKREDIPVGVKIEIQRAKREIELQIKDMSINGERILTRGFDAALDYLTDRWTAKWRENQSIFSAIIKAMVEEFIREFVQNIILQIAFSRGGGGIFNAFLEFFASIFGVKNVSPGPEPMPRIGGVNAPVPAVPATASVIVNPRVVVETRFDADSMRKFIDSFTDRIENRLMNLKIINNVRADTNWTKFTIESNNFVRSRRKTILIKT